MMGRRLARLIGAVAAALVALYCSAVFGAYIAAKAVLGS